MKNSKLKDILIGIIGVCCFIGIIGLLMAFDDGLLDGTLLYKIISIVLPAFIGTFLIISIFSFWLNKLTGNVPYLKFIAMITFFFLCISILFLPPKTLFIIAAIIIGLTLLSLVVLFFEQLR